ncbi:uncharacterized protein LOC130727039 [Lotus japonicus]|uniref:uncharacterized protein LOC130727039 n=1 Tax=Lotus japonicus TaxID=34305 RepID=UPI002584EB77|nr:uncharacterized protein LOC130727039 [Lotus japonicus]
MTNLISDVCLSKATSSFAARILCMWTLSSFDNPSDIGTIDMILMDHQNSKIQASIKGSAVIEIFNDKLMEGEVYRFSGLAVSDIIGLLFGQPQLTHYGKGKTKILNIDLLIDGHKMECALFGEYADEFNTLLHNDTSPSQVVVINMAVLSFSFVRSSESHDKGSQLNL